MLPRNQKTVFQTTSRRRLVSIVALGALLSVMVNVGAGAQNAEIDSLRLKRDEVRQEKVNLAREYDPVLSSIEELQSSVAVLNANRSEQELELELLEQQQAAAKAYADQLDQDIADLQGQVEQAKRNVVNQAVYMYVRPSDLEQIMEANDFNVTEKRETLLASVSGGELDSIEQLRQSQADLADLISESERASQDAVDAQAKVQKQITSVDESIAELEDAEGVLQDRLNEFFSEQAQLETAEADIVSLLNSAIEEENQRQALLEQQRIARERAAQAAQAAAALAAQRAAAQASSTTDATVAAYTELVTPSQPAPPYAGGTMLTPVGGPITSGWGMRVNPVSGVYKRHEGVDFGAASGTPIAAAATGTVISAGNAGDGYGNKVVIDHGGGVATLYAHQSSIAVSTGQKVGAGEIIGYVGSTGNSTGAHLHFEVRVNGTSYDPLGYL